MAILLKALAFIIWLTIMIALINASRNIKYSIKKRARLSGANRDDSNKYFISAFNYMSISYLLH